MRESDVVLVERAGRMGGYWEMLWDKVNKAAAASQVVVAAAL